MFSGNSYRFLESLSLAGVRNPVYDHKWKGMCGIPFPRFRSASLSRADPHRDRKQARYDPYDENHRILLSALTDRPGPVWKPPRAFHLKLKCFAWKLARSRRHRKLRVEIRRQYSP